MVHQSASHSDPTSRYMSEETQNTNSKKYINPYVHCIVIYKSQAMEETQAPINRQVDQKSVVWILILK